MAVFILILGLVIDISHFYAAKAELQNAADAAALAAASALRDPPETTALDIERATSRAVETLNTYEFNKRPVNIERGDVRFSETVDGNRDLVGEMDETAAKSNPANIRFVRVTIPAESTSIPIFFAYVLGNAKQLSATATARKVAASSIPVLIK